MADFGDLKSLKAEIERRAVKALETGVADKVKSMESEEVERVVLKPYTPRRHIRRDEHHGIQAVENMNASVKKSFKGELELSVVNDTPVADSSHLYRLDDAIVEGGNYFEYPAENRDENVYTYLKGRDFITATQERINSSGEVEKALKDTLKELGLEISDK